MRSGGLLQRKLEEFGISTISISNSPEMTIRVAVPRAVFIQFPFGRLLGDVDDREQQREICDDMVEMLSNANEPNSYKHLDYSWSDPPELTKWRPDIPAPLGRLRGEGKVDEELVEKNYRDEEREGL
tara:strand:- start:7655 stop:8035 length:381 start_codon:yes stop_codon:yes gene_type:complete